MCEKQPAFLEAVANEIDRPTPVDHQRSRTPQPRAGLAATTPDAQHPSARLGECRIAGDAGIERAHAPPVHDASDSKTDDAKAHDASGDDAIDDGPGRKSPATWLLEKRQTSAAWLAATLAGSVSRTTRESD